MFTITTLFIANRGEIAARIIRTCQKMGIKTVVPFSDADMHAPYLAQADIAVYLGASPPSESYLNQEKIIALALQYQAEAVHPGYGFLAENAAFAQKCRAVGLLFVGPKTSIIEKMGSKAAAKRLMEAHNIPSILGYQGIEQSVTALTKAAESIGFPILLKASAGGGGKGMRIVYNKQTLAKNIAAAKREALTAFGVDTLIIEKYIAQARHVEIQIVGDTYGHIVHLLERECSIQRRYQKVIEESPSPIVSPKLRERMGATAIKIATILGYDNAGTIEFLVDELSGMFYFLEVNTRLQVEHGVTEAVTGIDIVQLQIEIAEGMPLTLAQKDVRANGYALEARLYAEDPANDNLPVAGTIHYWEVPTVQGLRIDTAVQNGTNISVHYDPMIAKIIVHGANRRTVQRKMTYVLSHLKCLGIFTNQYLLQNIIGQAAFLKGQYTTHFLPQLLASTTALQATSQQIRVALIAVCLFDWHKRQQKQTLLQSLPSGWRNNAYAPQKRCYIFKEEAYEIAYYYHESGFELFIEGEKTWVKLVSVQEGELVFMWEMLQYHIHVVQVKERYFVHSNLFSSMEWQKKPRFPQPKPKALHGTFTSLMPSRVLDVFVVVGQEVEVGTALLSLSSMKMETVIEADRVGVVQEIYVKAGQYIDAEVLLLQIQ